jgi:ribosome-associated heat shock protein Hsp15
VVSANYLARRCANGSEVIIVANPLEQKRVRLDKWLWAARFFKTRTLAMEAIKGGKVHVDGQRARPSKEVRIGHEIVIRKGSTTWTVIVRTLSRQRRPASEAALLYSETEESRQTRLESQEQRKQDWMHRPLGSGRPTKKERRQLDRLMHR